MNKKISKILTIILSVCMLFTCASFPAFAEDSEYLILDCSTKKGVEAIEALKADTKEVKSQKYSAKWVTADVGALSFKVPSDITPYTELKFSLYSNMDCQLYICFNSENSSTDGSDYYGNKFNIIKGWQDISIDISSLKPSRTPRGYNAVDNLAIHAKGWGIENDLANLVLNFDSIYLVNNPAYTKLIASQQSENANTGSQAAEKNVGDAVIYNRTYDEVGKGIADNGGTAVAKSNKIGLAEDSGGNKFIRIETADSASEDCYFETNFSTLSTSIVVELSVSTENGFNGNLQYKDKNRKDGTLLNFKDFTVKSCDKEIATLKKGVFTDFKLVIDIIDKTVDVYVGDKLVLEKGKYSTNSELSGIQLMRLYIPKQNSAVAMLDNFKVYEGDKVRDIKDEQPSAEVSQPVSSASADISRLKGAVALKLGVPRALVDLRKTAIDESNNNVAPFVVNGRTLLPIRFVSEALGAKVNWNDSTRTVTVVKGSDTIELVIGSNIMKKNGSEIQIDVPAAIYYDRTMLPLRAVAEALGKKVFWDDMGFIVISDTENIFDREKDLSTMVAAMAEFVYERPTGEKIISDTLANSPSHPRLLATKSDFDRVRELNNTDETFKSWVATRLKSASSSADNFNPAKIVYVSDAGDRLSDPGTSNLQSWAFAYQITKEQKYLDTAVSMVEQLSKWEHWHPGHYLNCAAIVQNVAIAYDWMYEGLTDSQRKLFEDALYKYGITSGLGAYNGATDYMNKHGTFGRSGWTKTENNWNAVCNGGLTQACLALAGVERYNKDVSELMGKIIRSIEIGIRCYAPDGSYAESPGYWSYGTNNLLLMFESLYASTGTTYGLMSSPGLDVTCYFPPYIESPANGSWNYHDSGSGAIDTSHFFWAAKYLNDPGIAAIRYNDLINQTKTAGMIDILNYEPALAQGSVSLSLDKHFSGIETVTMRSAWQDKYAIFTGLHGGYNSVNHGDMDAGNFILDASGIRWITELGSENYNLPGMFGKGANGSSWKYYKKSSEGQNIVVVTNDTSIPYGANPLANIKISKFESKPKGAIAIADLTSNYGTSAKSAKRGVLFTDNRKTVVVQDEMTFKKSTNLIWGAHTDANIEISADGKSAVLSKSGKQMGVQLISNNPDLKFEVMDANGVLQTTTSVSGEYDRSMYKKLAIKANGVKEFNVAVAFKQITDGANAPSADYSFTNMDNWSIKDGEIIVPKLDEIDVNGSTWEKFSQNETSYVYKLPYGETTLPVITAKASSDYTVEITNASAPGESTVIKVYVTSDPSMYNIYTVEMRETKEIEAEASDTPEPDNVAENTLDSNLATRWAATGTPTITYTFANPKTISGVGIAFWKSDQRISSFTLEISPDGKNWTKVYEGAQKNKTDEVYFYEFAQATVKYVRITGHGNTSNDWTSILEVNFK